MLNSAKLRLKFSNCDSDAAAELKMSLGIPLLHGVSLTTLFSYRFKIYRSIVHTVLCTTELLTES